LSFYIKEYLKAKEKIYGNSKKKNPIQRAMEETLMDLKGGLNMALHPLQQSFSPYTY
jgi:hypothetical protein